MSKDPDTGADWADRHGVVSMRGGKYFSRGFVKKGNVESFLTYKKLHRTGRLLRSLKTFVRGNQIVMSSSSSYAKVQNEGGSSAPKRIKGKYVREDVNSVAFGGKIVARPFMTPSKQVRRLLITLVLKRMRKLGW